MKNYKFIDHTADIAMKVSAKTIPELFINSAKGVFSLIYSGKGTHGIRESGRHIYIKAETLEDLLINWLNELISVFYTYHFLPKNYNDIKIKYKDTTLLRGTIKGNTLDMNKLRKTITEIKSAAYHNVSIKRNDKRFETTIVFDV